MMKTDKNKLYEQSVYAFLWLQVFLVPVANQVRQFSDGIIWEDIWPIWIGILPFFILFLVHNYILIPRLFMKHHIRGYLISAAIALCIFGTFKYASQMWFRQDFIESAMKSYRYERPEREKGQFRPYAFSGDSRKFPMPPRHIRDFMPKPFVLDMFVALMMLGFNLSIVLLFRYQQEKERNSEIEKIHLEHELEYLKAQINPHFFMNMLNNIHSMVEVDQTKAQDMILQLSRLMRYVLYEGSVSGTSLNKEVDFIKNYVALMRQRYSDRKVRISLSLPDNCDSSLQVPPLLFIVFIENAFKHGISYLHPSYVDIRMDVSGDRLHFLCENSKVKKKENESPAGGVGLENVKKRLHLIFGDRHKLEIESCTDIYKVNLSIPCNRVLTKQKAK